VAGVLSAEVAAFRARKGALVMQRMNIAPLRVHSVHPAVRPLSRVIIREVAEQYGVPPEELTSGNLYRGFQGVDVVTPRHVAMHLTRRATRLSLKQIASTFGRHDHTTVISALRRIEVRRAKEPRLDLIVRALEARFPAVRQ